MVDKRIFFAFLKDNNAYNGFIINLTKRFKGDKNKILSYVRDTPMPSLIARAFSWENTKEQFDFWDGLNLKWLKFYKMMNK